MFVDDISNRLILKFMAIYLYYGEINLLFNFCLICRMIAEETTVRKWAVSTESKVVQFVDDYLINYPQANVRKSTEKLLTSLFRKGTEEQRASMIGLLTQRAEQLNSMGKSSEQFLSLISSVFDMFPQSYQSQKSTIFGIVFLKTREIFEKIIGNKEYKFYSLCSNMIDFGEEFKPYLLEANGCLKCFGRPQIDFEHSTIINIREELRAHLNSVEWVLKRTYELKNLTINFGKKKINYKSIVIYYLDQSGQRKQLGKFGVNDTVPSFSITTNVIGITFEFSKVRRNHISCIICSSTEDYSVVCSGCISKLIEMEASVKVVAGQADRINRELSESFKSMNGLREQLQKFASCVQENSKVSLIKSKIVQEMQAGYSAIIQNLRLLRNLSQGQLNEEKRKYSQVNCDCYSCHFYEFLSCINFILLSLKNVTFHLDVLQLQQLLMDFKAIFAHNQMHVYNSTISLILAEVFSRFEQVDYFKQIDVQQNSGLTVELLVNLVQQFKVRNKEKASYLQQVQRFILEGTVSNKFSILERIRLFVVLALNEEQYCYLGQELQVQKLQDIKRLSTAQFQKYNQLLAFQPSEIFSLPICNVIKLFLVLLPQQQIPVSSLDINDASYLKYIRNVPPVIDDALILSNIVFSPNPVIKLNLFKLLPQIIKLLPLQSSIEIIKQLCKYKPLWNTYIRQTVESFDHMLDEVENQRKMMLCLEGYDASKENLYFEHIYKLLTPQRPSFIIRLEIPEKEMQKQEKNKGGPVEYIYLPIREVKSQDLKGDTIGALHEWITDEIKRMNHDMTFDLIVENNILDNLDLSLEIIYRKIVQKEAKRQIGHKVYDFFRVIYRIQGIFGEANERNCGNPRDQKLEQCINFSSHLLRKLPHNRRTGLDILMQIIPTLQRNNQGRDRRYKMIKILEIIFKNESIIRKVVEWQYGNHVLSMAVKFISLNKQDLKVTEMLLQMCSKIIDEANKEMVRIRKNSEFISGRKGSEGEIDVEGEGDESEKAVKYVLERVKEAEESGFKHISKKLIKILPFCSKDDMGASRYLFDYFEVNKILQIKYSQKLSWFLEFIQALSESYSSFKTICRDEGVSNNIIQLVVEQLPLIVQIKDKESIQNLELAMTLLKALIQGDFNVQQYLFAKGTLEIVNRIGGVGTAGIPEAVRSQLGKIPLICFEIIKYFQEGKMISVQVHDYFVKNEEEKRKAIQTQKSHRKEQILKKKRKVMESLQHLIKNEDNELLMCSSCKQGYSKKREVLGVYLYSSKQQILSLQNWWRDNKKVQSITSTSYFEPIHLQCHNDAMKDDLKIQKTQWDGAIIRNSEVLCNNWCAFKGADTTDEEYEKVYRKYFERNNKTVSFWVALNDLNGLLEKFSKEYNFAIETKGSSHTHNAKLIPVLMVLTCHLLKGNEEIKYLREGVTYIEENLTKKANVINLYFCVVLFVYNLGSFNSRRAFCLKLIDQLGYGNFKDSKPLYLYLAMVQAIMKLTHKTIAEGAELVAGLSSFIPKNFNELVQSFEIISEEYKNVYLKWESFEQVKQYFEQRS